MQVLILKLEAPTMAFGTVAVDSTLPTAVFPLKSMIVGVLGNALGYRRSEHARLGALQDAVSIASRLDRPGKMMEDFQTAKLGDKDRVWSTRGYPIGRSGGEDTYESPELVYRGYLQDAAVTTAVSIADGFLADVIQGLQQPERPLFLGRKSCFPTCPLFSGVVEASSLLEALKSAPLSEDAKPESDGRYLAQWPYGMSSDEASKTHSVPDLKDWLNNVHVGSRYVHEGAITVTQE